MMSNDKMTQSLDDIVERSKSIRTQGRGGRRHNPTRAAASSAPIGGVSKATRQNKQPRGAPAAPAAASTGETKIMVSNLPLDVEQAQLQEYFAAAVGVGRPKKILLQYGPNGRSLGSATIIFNKHDQALKATNALNGVKIDNRPVRVEMLVSAANIPPPAPKQSLADRVTQSKKDKPKPATAAKSAPASGRGRGRGEGRGRGRGRGGREPRPRTRTAEELDADMDDYFINNEGNADTMATNGAQAAAPTGDTAMVEAEEML